MLGSMVHPGCVKAVAEAVALLEDLGHEVEERAPDLDGPVVARSFLQLVVGEVGAELEELQRELGRRPRRSELEPLTWALGLVSGALSAREHADSLRVLEESGARVARFFQDWDVLVTPTVAAPPPETGSLPPNRSERRQLRLAGLVGSGRLIKLAGLIDRMAESAFDFASWTPVFNISGQPAMSVPLHWNADGLPVGVHCVGRVGDEATLLRLAGQLERAKPWFGRLPSL